MITPGYHRNEIKNVLSRIKVNRHTVSKRAGLSAVSFNEWLNGKKDLKVSSLEKIYIALESIIGDMKRASGIRFKQAVFTPPPLKNDHEQDGTSHEHL